MNISDLIEAGETGAIEFKSTLRKNLHTGSNDPRMEATVLKTIAGFLNTNGGTLIIGVSDAGSPVGVELDAFPSEDAMALHLINLLKDRLGGQHALDVKPQFELYDGKRVLVVRCKPAKAPVFTKDGSLERFYVRYGPSTQELTGSDAQAFIRRRFS